MIYCDKDGKPTSNPVFAYSFNLTKDTSKDIVNLLVNNLEDSHHWNILKEGNYFINISLHDEGYQFDLMLSWNYKNRGVHQRGIQEYYLIVGIIGVGCFGFSCNNKHNNTSTYYYQEKLGIYSEVLATFLNDLRDEIYKLRKEG